MKHSYLEVTYRKGRPLAAYYHLPRQDSAKSARTVQAEGGLLVDYPSDGTPIGIEITSPASLHRSQLNQLSAGLGYERVAREDLAPLPTA
jgi:hypothetical protein